MEVGVTDTSPRAFPRTRPASRAAVAVFMASRGGGQGIALHVQYVLSLPQTHTTRGPQRTNSSRLERVGGSGHTRGGNARTPSHHRQGPTGKYVLHGHRRRGDRQRPWIAGRDSSCRGGSRERNLTMARAGVTVGLGRGRIGNFDDGSERQRTGRDPHHGPILLSLAAPTWLVSEGLSMYEHSTDVQAIGCRARPARRYRQRRTMLRQCFGDGPRRMGRGAGGWHSFLRHLTRTYGDPGLFFLCSCTSCSMARRAGAHHSQQAGKPSLSLGVA